jgi:hypothetical protein
VYLIAHKEVLAPAGLRVRFGCAGLDVLEPHSAHNAGVFLLPQRVLQYFEALTATRHTERDILLAPTNIRCV